MRNFQPNIYAVEPVFMQSFLESIADIDVSEMEARIESQMESRLTFSQILNGERESILFIKGVVATIHITGFLSPEGPSIFEMLFGFGGTAYSDIQKAVAEAAADESIEKIVLMVDSPGGTVVGVDETWQAIAAANDAKPVEAINAGIMASAAYYLSSAAGKISATSPQNETGSIGVIIAGFDMSEAFEKRGVKRVVIVSENAPNKDQSLWAGAGAEALQARVDAAERIFIQRISEGRGIAVEDIKNTFARGSVFVAKDPLGTNQDALSVGMIDAVQGVVTESVNISSNTIVAETKPPAKREAGQSQEVKTMATLKEVMAGDPAVAAEVETLTTNAKAEGFTAGTTEAETKAKARADAAAPFLKADSGYGASIRGLAAKVATGEASIDALQSAVAAVDEMRESATGDEAAAEAKKLKETPPNAKGKGAQPAEDGSVENEEQFEALFTKDQAEA